MRLFPRRPAPAPLADIPTRAIAVGSLSGIAPADVRANLLIVVDADGGLSMSGVACDELLMLMLSRCSFIISQRIHDRHVREHHGDES